MIAQTKKQAIALRDEKVHAKYPPELARMIMLFLIDIGAERDLPSDKQERKSYLRRFHEAISVNNPFYPDHLPFYVVYPKFFTHEVAMNSRKGNSISSLIGAFNKWINQNGVIEGLQESWYQSEPDKRPKGLKPVYGDTQSEIDMNRLIEGKKVHEWPDEVIIDQYKKIMALYDDKMISHLSQLGVKSYAIKIIEQVKKRDLIDGEVKAGILYG